MPTPSLTPRDRLYASAQAQITEFAFDEQVATVFPDMIQRSVPGYGMIINALKLLAERYAQPDSQLYDLGCSLGAATLALRHGITHTGCRIIAVDNAAAMVERCQAFLVQDTVAVPVEVHCADVQTVEISNASVVVLNFTLQFIPLSQRVTLIRRIYNGLRPGGVLVLSEKIIFSDPHWQRESVELHHAFKRANGYSDLEISQKRSALEQVLVPETLETHQQRLHDVGFAASHVWLQQFNFISLLAWKS